MLRRYQTNQGFVLVIVIGAIAVAAIIAGSYLLFVDDHRERTARVSDEATTQIALEQNILRVQSEIQSLAKNEGKIDLQEINLYLASNPLSTSSKQMLSLTLDGYEDGTAQIDSIANTLYPLTSLESQGDPFIGAKANVLSVEVRSSDSTATNVQSRLSSKMISANPEIDVRSIPVSQFTAFSSGTGVDVDSANFIGSLGRVFALGDIQLSGSFSTNYPLVSGGSVSTDGSLSVSLEGSFPIQIPSGLVAYAQPADATQAAWLAEARTQYDNAIVTPGTIPVSLILPPVAGETIAPNTRNANSSLDLGTVRNRCDLLVLVQANSGGGYQVSALRGNSNWLFAATQIGESRAQSNLGAKGEVPGKGVGRQNDPVVARKIKISQTNGPVVAALNYGALGQEARQQVHSIYVEFDSSIKDTVVLVRGAQNLQDGITIASRSPVLVAGDFNTGQNPVAASILTAQGVVSVDPSWGNSTFGPAP